MYVKCKPMVSGKPLIRPLSDLRSGETFVLGDLHFVRTSGLLGPSMVRCVRLDDGSLIMLPSDLQMHATVSTADVILQIQ